MNIIMKEMQNCNKVQKEENNKYKNGKNKDGTFVPSLFLE
mgnify:FL=1